MGRTIKFVALSAFWYCVGIFLLAFTSNTLANLGFQGWLIERNTVWVWALIGAVASIAIGVASWNFSGVGHVRAVRHNVGNGLALGNGWGNAVGGTMQKHSWLIAGILLSIATVWFGYNYHQTTADWIVIILLATGAVLCFAQEFGKAGEFLGGWWKHGLPVTWFVLSIIFTATLWNDAENEWMFWTAFVSFVASSITLYGGKEAWKSIGSAVGKMLLDAFAFKYSKALSFILWGVVIFLVGSVVFDLDDVTDHFGDLGSYNAGSMVWVGFWALIVVGVVVGLAEGKKK